MEAKSRAYVESNMDLSQVAPIDPKLTVSIINHYIMRTVTFLNNFSRYCEAKMMKFEYKLQKLEASLVILESKLDSIPLLANDQPEVIKVTETSTNPPTEEVENVIKIEDQTNLKEETDKVVVENPQEKLDLPVEVITERVKAKDDERYKRFFKMVQVGVPQAAVKLKMKAEGVDPTILDNPNAMIGS